MPFSNSCAPLRLCWPRSEAAISNGKKCVEKLEASADRQQAELEASGAPVPPTGNATDELKKETIDRGVLNDAAACFYVIGSAAESLSRRGESAQAYREATRYTYARVWDPRDDTFWSPAEVAKDRLSKP
jgi:hypothetical protein